jgi:glycosyltransferase involved in cell wall biosynthesis
LGHQRKTRVLHVGKFYPPHHGGMETHLRDLCLELSRSGEFEVEALVASDTRHRQDEFDGEVKITRAGTIVMAGAAPICPGMISHLRRSEADIVHLHHPNPMALVAYLASGLRKKLVVTYHSDIVRQKILSVPFAPILHRALGRSDAILVTSPNYLDSSPVLQCHRQRCRVVPLGIYPEQFEAEPAETAAIREKYGPRIVLSVGRLIYYKGFEYLISAMRTIDAKLLIVGNGPLRANLEDVARQNGATGKVVFIANAAELTPYYHAADVFVLAAIARSEAFGLVQLEAMAAGRPVINTRLDSGVPFVSLDGVTGITVPPANADALANALNRLLADPRLRASYGHAGRERVRQQFSAPLAAARTMEIYRSLLEPKVERSMTASQI